MREREMRDRMVAHVQAILHAYPDLVQDPESVPGQLTLELKKDIEALTETIEAAEAETAKRGLDREVTISLLIDYLFERKLGRQPLTVDQRLLRLLTGIMCASYDNDEADEWAMGLADMIEDGIRHGASDREIAERVYQRLVAETEED